MEMKTKFTFVTAQGLKRLEEELHYLRTVKRAEIAQNLHDTVGDEEDNEYMLALDERSFIEGRIQEIERLLANVRVIGPGNSNGYVQMGSTVVVREDGTPIETYMIVGSPEANPREGFISDESPLGKALIGHRAGEDVEVDIPGGKMKYRLIAVR
jgi:transcription elongation factor GreA